MVAPEFQLMSENMLVSLINSLHKYIYTYSNDQRGQLDPEDPYSRLNLYHVTELAADTQALINHLDLILLGKRMSSELKTILADHLDTPGIFSPGRAGQLEKAREAMALIIASPDFLIQR